MEENKSTKQPLRITFKIDIPETINDSIFNSIILGLCDYINMKDVEFRDIDKQKLLNDILMKVQHQIDDLIILED